MKPGRKPYKERNALIKQLVKTGKTYEAIGAQMGLTRQRVHQLVHGIEHYGKGVDKSASKSLTRV